LSRRLLAFVVVVLTSLLLVCAFLLVTSQHRARGLFVDLERAQAEARNRDVEWNRLRIELSRTAQPGYVEQTARQLGLKPVDSNRTVFVSAPAAPKEAQ